MKEILRKETSILDHQVTLTVFIKGDGIIVDFSGPNDHMGGIGLGIPYKRKDGTSSAHSNSWSLPGHRDSEIAVIMARVIAKFCRKPTVVLFGMSIKNLKEEELKRIFSKSNELAEEIGKSIYRLLTLK